VNNLGCLEKYVKVLQILNPKFTNEVIGFANQLKGFLCNLQIPFLYVLASQQEGEMVEIGCWYGRTTTILRIASDPNKLKINCIDTFLGSSEHQDELKGYKFRSDFEANLRQLGILDKVTIIEDTSLNASQKFPDGSLSVVWIDAAHDYDNVKQDVLKWLPKLKNGGLMLGHDYPEPTDPNGGFEELTKAVNETVRDNKKFKDFGWFCGIWGAIKV
jgi:predicted O-methyltransferase YrrM